jgi:hypothetical protein
LGLLPAREKSALNERLIESHALGHDHYDAAEVILDYP